ncbi:hypothetical protein AB0J72_52055 [Dactylosporangium sp. NPDC049742]|uniref:hypothetical protein n=1 Tax=Dactylosporangium sp. NPDC049742 TaxID=3154737 RepID=UPI003430C54F
MKVTKSKFGVAALAVGGVLAFAVPAGAAVNLQSESPGHGTVKIAKQAQLKAKGAATVVTLNVSCPAGWVFTGYVSVTQAVGNITTGGSNRTSEIACTGYTQKVKVPVTASPAPFKVGDAYALGEIQVRSPGYQYFFANTGREIVNVQS